MLKKGLMFALFTALVSGFSIFINKFGVKGIDPYVFTGTKNIVVAVFLIAFVLMMRDHKTLFSLKKPQWFKLGLIGFFGGSIPFLLFFKGLSITSAASGAFIHKTMFIFVTIGAIMFLKEKVNKTFVIGALALLGGNYLLLKLNAISFGAGEILILTATLLWAVENLISKHTLKDVSSRIVALGRMGFGSLFIILFWAFTGRVETALSLTLPQLIWVALTAAFLFLYVSSWYYALQRLKASVATSILLLGSPITTLLSFVFLGSPVTLAQAFGMVLVFVGILVIVVVSDRVKVLLPSRS